MEQELQLSQLPERLPVPSDSPRGCTTRGVNISSRYTELMSKSRREEVEKQVITEAEPSVMETEVQCLCILSDASLF